MAFGHLLCWAVTFKGVSLVGIGKQGLTEIEKKLVSKASLRI